MAADKKAVKRISFVYLQKLQAGVCLLALCVMLASGLMSSVPVTTICWRAALVMIGVIAITRIIISILANYEEINASEK